MAKSINNVVMQGASGKIADMLIFRQRAGKTIIAKIGQRSKALTMKQKAVNAKFKAAAAYAKVAMQDDTIKALYNAKAGAGVFPFNVAVADYFTAPEVKEINFASYTGVPNSTIQVLADDDFMLKKVKVSVTTAGGALLEEGEALPDTDSAYYVFTTSQTNNALSGTSIEVTATDMAGNSTIKEVLIP